MSFDLYLLYRRCAKGLTFVEMQSQAAQARKNGKKQLQSGKKKGRKEKQASKKWSEGRKGKQKEQVSPQAKIHKRIKSIQTLKKSRGLRKPECRELKKKGRTSHPFA